MKNKPTISEKGMNAFHKIYIVGIIFAVSKLITYLQWTFQLAKIGVYSKNHSFLKLM